MKNKIGLVISREYLSRVQKKSFLLTTILVPLVFIAFYIGIIAITMKGSTDKEKIAVIDEANILNKASLDSLGNYVLINNKTEKVFVNEYKDAGYKAFLYIPSINIDSPKNIVLHSKSTMNLSTSFKIEQLVNKAIEAKRLAASGIAAETYKKIKADVDIENTIDTETGSKKSVAGVAYGVSFICGMLIYIMMIIYGTQVMRGVSEEKTNRIAEVMVSSIKPFQLMMGKIIGIGAVGLTQFAIWIILMVTMQLFIPLIFPDLLSNATAANATAAANTGVTSTILTGLSSLPLLKIGLSFTFYFLAGYLTYAALFAAVGSMATDDQQESQQLMFPILMPIILGFVIMTKAVSDPQSGLAVFGSLFPLTSPIVMMGRITYDVPWWQMALSMALLIGCFIFLTWLTAKVYRMGILMYGKKPSWKEMFKLAFRKN
ncbi:ABC transporter permease [Ferruginibacter yonginensis]|uniref:ABC transporter permease n=1 Tax=Ferruginibacter yonginensis TaxID=1310416 RepID=A0ABV8QTN8_9BACT